MPENNEIIQDEILESIRVLRKQVKKDETKEFSDASQIALYKASMGL